MLAYDPLNPAITRNPYRTDAPLREDLLSSVYPPPGVCGLPLDDVVKTLTEPEGLLVVQIWPACWRNMIRFPREQADHLAGPPDHVPIRKLAAKIFRAEPCQLLHAR